MKKYLLLCLLLLSGCSNQFHYRRSTDHASILRINMDEVNEKIENRDTFMFMDYNDWRLQALKHQYKVIATS